MKISFRAFDGLMATDPPVSEKQRRAMYAAAEGKSTLGIPKRVGKEFVGKDVAPAAGVLYITPDGKGLFLKRSKDTRDHGGEWCIPGGMVEDLETSAETAYREAQEELGSVPKREFEQRTVVTNVDDVQFTTHFILVDCPFTPTLNYEHDAWAWMDLNKPPEPLHPGLKIVLDTVLSKSVAADMTKQDWQDLVQGFIKFIKEEENEPEHSEDVAKLSKESVNYSKGKGDTACRNCVHYLGGSCEIVSGQISPDYWCEKFQAKAADDQCAMDEATVRTRDADGRLHVSITNISKANVCPYYGREIPDGDKLGLDPDRIYNLLRDPTELVIASATFNNIPLLSKHVPVNTLDHHPELVIGATGTDAIFVEPYLRNSLVVWVQDYIDAIESEEQKELSCCYRYRADMTPGEYHGQRYDGVMRDIIGNHVALVRAGRAGPDVFVGDSAMDNLGDQFAMSKIVLSPKAAVAKGALMVFLRPKLAADAQLDLNPILAGVNQQNFSKKRSALLSGVTSAVQGKLAADAKLDGLDDLLLALDEYEENEEMPEAEDDEDEDKDKKDKGEDEESEEAEENAKGEDEEEDDKEKEKEKGKDRKARDRKARDKARDAEEDEKEEMKKKAEDKKAMDERINAAVLRERQNQQEIRDALSAVRPHVGELSMAFDSAEEVYRSALKLKGVDTTDINLPGMKALLQHLPKPSSNSNPDSRHAMDSATVDDFAKRFPNAARIRPTV